MAAQIPWLELEGLGGTNDGVVGALAGAALRLQGEDGRFRGRWIVNASGVSLGNRSGRGKGKGNGGGRKRKADGGNCNATSQEPLRLGLLKEYLRERLGQDACIESIYGAPFDDDELVLSCVEAKPVLRHKTLTMLAARDEGGLRLLTKVDLDAHESAAKDAAACECFAFDNDAEEYGAAADQKSCANCLFRRVLASGYACMKKEGTA